MAVFFVVIGCMAVLRAHGAVSGAVLSNEAMHATFGAQNCLKTYVLNRDYCQNFHVTACASWPDCIFTCSDGCDKVELFRGGSGAYVAAKDEQINCHSDYGSEYRVRECSWFCYCTGQVFQTNDCDKEVLAVIPCADEPKPK